jgi:hypothetical protein
VRDGSGEAGEEPLDAHGSRVAPVRPGAIR